MNIRRALEIATMAHKDQIRKCGEDYINHPIRVALSMDTEDEKITALLHDVVEDSDMSFDDLIRLRFNQDITLAIMNLTRIKGVSYKEYLSCIKDNKLATKVKIADINDNLDISRIECLTEKDLDRCRKYRNALEFLNEKDEK